MNGMKCKDLCIPYSRQIKPERGWQNCPLRKIAPAIACKSDFCNMCPISKSEPILPLFLLAVGCRKINYVNFNFKMRTSKLGRLMFERFNKWPDFVQL